VDAPATDVSGRLPLRWPVAFGTDLEGTTRDSDDLAAAAFDATEITTALDAAEITAKALGQLPALSQIEQAILEFERHWWRRPGAKEQAIRDSFEMSPTRYYQALNALLDLPQALSYDPTLVNRLQRLRSSTMRTRRLA
jgi:uncharacterized protein DUF3263